MDTLSENETLECNLQRFWSLESLGILPEKETTLEQFVQQISFDKGQYEVCLPWKESHPPLTSNYELCHRRLNRLYKRLKQDPERLHEYDAVIKDQLSKGVIEVVQNPNGACENRINYLPHHAIVRSDKETTKLRMVYDASARDNGPSLNDCLYTGPKFGQNILEILLRFRIHNVALIGDVEKAFLMISVSASDRDVLRFLWY